MKLKDAEIEITLVVSTGHLTKEDNDLLEKGSAAIFSPGKWGDNLRPYGTSALPVSVYPFHHGFIVHVHEELGEPSFEKEVSGYGLSEHFWNVLKAGKAHGATWVKFDCDGLLYDELPCFDW